MKRTMEQKEKDVPDTPDTPDANTLLRNAIAESIGYSGMEHLARVSKYALETANEDAGT